VSAAGRQAIHAVYDAWNTGGLEGAMQALPEDIRWETPPESPEPEVVEGRQAARDSMRTWLEEWDSLEISDLVLEDFGDRVLACLTQHVTGRSSGVVVEGRLYMLWTEEQGKLVRMQMFLDEQRAREAVAEGRAA
jgi:ketosteroid isomerase-like protein